MEPSARKALSFLPWIAFVLPGCTVATTDGATDTGPVVTPDMGTPTDSAAGDTAVGDTGVVTDASDSTPPDDTADGGGPTCPTGGCPVLTTLTAGYRYTCGATAAGTIYCWGDNSAGTFGDGSKINRKIPRQVAATSDFVQLSAGSEHACGIKKDKTVWCWGSGSNGQLGDGLKADSLVPVQVKGLTGVTMLGHGTYATCALKDDGTVWCWGRGSELGVLAISSADVPQKIPDIADATHLTMADGSFYSSGSTGCLVRRPGTVWCWGDNRNGQQGNGTLDSNRIPTEVERLSGVLKVETGGTHTCALLIDGTVQCWGASDTTGSGMSRDRVLRPAVVVGLKGVQNISLGGDFAFAMLKDGTVQAWGRNNIGQLGLGRRSSTTPEFVPVEVPALKGARLLDAGFDHSCAAMTDGSTRCWGSNSIGGLGDDTETSRESPTPVRW